MKTTLAQRIDASTPLQKTVAAALMAALCCVATMIIRVPSPTGGYVNLGDGLVLLSGWLLGPVYGLLAGGIGSMLADLLAGYVAYMPGTLVIKALVALTAWGLFYLLNRKTDKHPLLSLSISALASECIMIGGYLMYESILLGDGFAALYNVPGNAVQGVLGLLVGTGLYLLLAKRDIRV